MNSIRTLSTEKTELQLVILSLKDPQMNSIRTLSTEKTELQIRGRYKHGVQEVQTMQGVQDGQGGRRGPRQYNMYNTARYNNKNP